MTAAKQVGTNPLVSRLKTFYEDFSMDNLASLDDFYTQDIEFADPIHTVTGILSLKQYFKKMSVNLTHYRIRYLDMLAGENSAYLSWEMDFANRHVNRGKVITIRGMSHLRFTSKIYYHEDSYDMGALLYDHLPLLGSITRSLKGRMADHDN